MGNVEPLGSRSPINARGSLIHQENKRQLSRMPFGAGLMRGGRPSCARSNQRDLRYALLRDTKVRDE